VFIYSANQPLVNVSVALPYFSMKLGELWVHTNEQRNSFYGEDSDQTSITLLINDASETIKGFKTLFFSISSSNI
jgi:hypothetical protein